MTVRLAVLCLLAGALAPAPVHAASRPPAEARNGRVTALRLESDGTDAALRVEVDGPVRWSHFALSNPARVVVDITGAQNSLPLQRFARIERGGVAGVQTSQFKPNVVRVVVHLTRAAPYEVSRTTTGLRVALRTQAAAFEPWVAGALATAAGAAPRPAPQRAAPELTEEEQAELDADEAEAELARLDAARPAAQQPNQQQPRQARFGQGPSRRPRITVTFEEADIRDVLATFAEFADRSIVPGQGVTGAISGVISDQPWDVALAALLEANGFAAEEMPSGIIRVDQVSQIQARQALEPLVTQTFRVNYVPAQELVTSLEALRTERGRVVAQATTNSIVVTDVENAVENILRLAGQLDIATPQVTIESKIVFVNRTDTEDLGFTYDLRDTRGSEFNRVVQGRQRDAATGELTGATETRDIFLLGGSSVAAIGNAASRVTNAALDVAISLVLGRYSLVTFISALQGAELADVQAVPVITTLDNQEAQVLVGERTPIRVIDVGSAAGGGAGGGIPRASVQLEETGVRLRVTPHITADRRVLMQIAAERSSVQPGVGDAGVSFATQEAQTRLLVNDGETAVIGGLTVSEVTQTRTGIPILMDLPFIGSLFRTTRDREQKRDLLIMVTPHIVDDQR